ncbi:DUF2808 domain-containing protein [Nodularia chucula]|uniref:DUF2808 domain-containing protein n=1 Tax=Nodularia chucula TaxID=3093667 RepID=UPI0039C6990C
MLCGNSYSLRPNLDGYSYNKKATVAFSEPVVPGTTISIRMKGVKTPGYEGTWHYPVSVKKIDMKEEIPLGLARVQTYGG